MSARILVLLLTMLASQPALGAVCGDTILDPGEQCDDGNTTSGDGCSDTCQFEGCPLTGTWIGGPVTSILSLSEDASGNIVGVTYPVNDPRNATSLTGTRSGTSVTLTIGGSGVFTGVNGPCDTISFPVGLVFGRVRTSYCGDGTVDAAEACDDGNFVNGNGTNGDGCSVACTAPQCGNGVVETGEVCDDYNLVNGDGCSATCEPNVCGNTILEPGEQCDDGNTTQGDGCTARCQTQVCGNTAVEPGEQCDDGNTTSGDGCSATCQFDGGCTLAGTWEGYPVIGPQTWSFAEGPTGTITGVTYGAFVYDIVGSRVGTNVQLVASGFPLSGSLVDCNTVAFTSPLTFSITRVRSTYCGDGTVQPPESCDDGNFLNGDACGFACLETGCGNGFVEAGEQCDDGNVNDDDCCTSSCVWAPNGATCSDGNDCTGGDACAAGACVGLTVDDRDGDGVCDAVDTCPDAPNTGQNDADTDGVDDACDNCPAEANPDQRDSDGQAGGDVCDPCPLLAADTCNAAQSAGMTVDSAGGAFTSPDTKVGVTIPAGALSAPTSISMTESGNETVVGTSRVVFRTEFGPDGLFFTLPVTLRFKWDDANGDGLIDGIQGSLFELRETNLRVWRNGVPLTGSCGSPTHQQPACATACGGVACCCDMVANTWTLSVFGFSEYVVGDSEAMLLPGGRRAATDCVLEWEVRDPQETPATDRHGLPTTKRSCVDGDRLCDADGLADGTCTFVVRACANVADERLVDRNGAPACAAADLAGVVLKRPRPTDGDPTRAAAAVALRDALAGLGPSAVGGASGEAITYTPALTAGEVCTAGARVQVPLAGRARKTLRVTLEGRTSAGASDRDVLRLRCDRAP